MVIRNLLLAPLLVGAGGSSSLCTIRLGKAWPAQTTKAQRADVLPLRPHVAALLAVGPGTAERWSENWSENLW
jgi:hypothetical protein